MGLQQNLNDIQTNLLSAKTAIAQSISNKGVECSADDKLSSFASKIDSITTGSTGGKFVLPKGLKFGYSTAFDPTLYDVSNVTDMSYMFSNCSGLTDLDLSSWDVSNVTNMGSMFNYCFKITELDLTDWNTINVAHMNTMFYYCTGLTSLNISTWNVSNVTNMSGMFNSCTKLTSLNISTWNVSNVTNMSNMFYNCIALTDLQLPDLGHNERCTSLDLSTCPKLTKDSVLYLFNNAFDRATAGYSKAFTIKLNAKTKALLSEDEIAIATNKGFTVA